MEMTATLKHKAAELSGMQAQTAAVDSKILAAAEKRLAVVDADLAKLQPRIETEPDAADRYQHLTTERGRLAMVIARARR